MKAEKPVRILHVFGNLNRGGSENMVMNVYRHIDCSKVQFDFMVHTTQQGAFEQEITSLGGRIFRVPAYRIINHIQYVKAWKQFFREHHEIKLVHGHMFTISAIYLSIAVAHGCKAIVHSHSTSSGRGVKGLVKTMFRWFLKYRKYDYLFACSQQAGCWLFGDDSTFKVVKNGIDIDKYLFNNVLRKKMRSALELSNGFVLGHVGSFTPAKNHMFLLEIFAQICHLYTDSKLLLVGDGELRGAIEEKIHKLKITDKVILTGSVGNVHEYFQAMDLFVFPSVIEGLPVSVLEAQASGLVCIVSDIITDEVNITNNIQRLSVGSDSQAWVNAILKNINVLKDRNVSIECLKKSGFDAKETAAKLESFYLNVD